MVYFGPEKQAQQYFIDMGYQPTHCQTTTDFLVSGSLLCGWFTGIILYIDPYSYSHRSTGLHMLATLDNMSSYTYL